MPLLTGVLHIEDSTGQRITAIDEHGGTPPTVIRLKSGLTWAAILEGAHSIVEISAEAGQITSNSTVYFADVVSMQPVAAFGEPADIDGLVIKEGTRVLRVGDNDGVRVVSTGAWGYDPQMPIASKLSPGVRVHISGGTLYKNTELYLANIAESTVGSTPLDWRYHPSGRCDADRYGLVPDLKEYADGVVVASTRTLSSQQASFVPDDVGKTICFVSPSNPATGTVTVTGPTAIAGTVTITAGSGTLVGSSSTNFATLYRQQRIRINGKFYYVAAPASDSHHIAIETAWGTVPDATDAISGATAVAYEMKVHGSGTSFVTQLTQGQQVATSVTGGTTYQTYIASNLLVHLCEVYNTNEPDSSGSGATLYRSTSIVTTIEAVIDAHTIRVSTVGASVSSGVRFGYGTDNTPMLQSAIDAKAGGATGNYWRPHGGGTTVWLNYGQYMIAGTVRIDRSTSRLELRGISGEAVLVGCSPDSPVLSIGSGGLVKVQNLMVRSCNPDHTGPMVEIVSRAFYPRDGSTAGGDAASMRIDQCTISCFNTSSQCSLLIDGTIFSTISQCEFEGFGGRYGIQGPVLAYANGVAIDHCRFSGFWGNDIFRPGQCWQISDIASEHGRLLSNPRCARKAGVNTGPIGYWQGSLIGYWAGDMGAGVRNSDVDEEGNPTAWVEARGGGLLLASLYLQNSNADNSDGVRLTGPSALGYYSSACALMAIASSDTLRITGGAVAVFAGANSFNRGIFGKENVSYNAAFIANEGPGGSSAPESNTITGTGLAIEGNVLSALAPDAQYKDLTLGHLETWLTAQTSKNPGGIIAQLYGSTGHPSGSIAYFTNPRSVQACEHVFASRDSEGTIRPYLTVSRNGVGFNGADAMFLDMSTVYEIGPKLGLQKLIHWMSTAAVSPSTGAKGATFTVSGTGVTPGGTAHVHIKQPNTVELTAVSVTADATGAFSTTWVSNGSSQTGSYTYWIIDDMTTFSSNVVTFSVT